MGIKYCAISGDNIEREAAGAGLEAGGDGESVTDICGSTPLAFRPLPLACCIKALFCVRVNGPRKYDRHHRVSKTAGSSSCTLFMRNSRVPRPARVCSKR